MVQFLRPESSNSGIPWQNFEHDCSLSSLYSTCSKEISNCIHTLLQIHWAVFLKTYHFELIPAFWNLIYFPIVGNHSYFRKYWLHANQSRKRFAEISFKQVNAFSKCFAFGRVAVNHRHIICKRNRWKIPQHTVADVYILMLLYLECK